MNKAERLEWIRAANEVMGDLDHMFETAPKEVLPDFVKIDIAENIAAIRRHLKNEFGEILK